MAIQLQLGDEIFEIPVVGDPNWGEAVTAYLRKNSEIIATIQGPQDILLTEAPLVNAAVDQPIAGLSFDTSTLQQIEIKGIITRTFLAVTGLDPKVDSFKIEGMYDGTNFYIENEFVGTDAQVSIDVENGGQFTYSADDVVNTETVSIKFKASAIVDV